MNRKGRRRKESGNKEILLVTKQVKRSSETN